MTAPRDPGGTDPADQPGRPTRRGRHWAPDDEQDPTPSSRGEDAPSDEVDAVTSSSSHESSAQGTSGAPESQPAADPSAADAPSSNDPMSNDPADDDPPSGVAPDGDPHGDPTNDHPTSSDPANDDPANDDPANDDPANDDPANDEAEPAVVAAGPRSGPRHAASGAGLRLQPWMLAVAAVIVIGLLAWLIIALTTGDDSDPAAEQSSQSTSSAATSSAAPTPVDPVSLPQVLCMGQSYAMLETGQTAEQLLADPGAVEAQYPGSKLSTIPPGCIAGSDTRDQVVLALGPFPSLQEACTAGGASGVTFAAYEGSADMGLKAATCPPE